MEAQNSEACEEMEADRQPYASFEGDCMQCAMVVRIPFGTLLNAGPASTQRMPTVAPRLCLQRSPAKCEPLLVQPLQAKCEPLGISEVKQEAHEDAVVLAPQRRCPRGDAPPLSLDGGGMQGQRRIGRQARLERSRLALK